MTTLKAFDEMMGQFLGELAIAFPEEPAKTGPKCDVFIKQVGPWASKMTARDDTFFCEDNEFAKDLNLHVIWQSSDCSETTKNAIWQYIQSMYMIGSTMSMFPPETLSAIEAMAENCAKTMKANPNGQLDEKALMSSMNSMMAQMMSGGGPLAGLAGIGGPPPSTRALPQAGPRKKKKAHK